MCIRDRYQRRVRGPSTSTMGKGAGQGGLFEVKSWTMPAYQPRTQVPTPGQVQAEVRTGVALAQNAVRYNKSFALWAPMGLVAGYFVIQDAPGFKDWLFGNNAEEAK
eukprot:TRINITY_DN968_c0_g1_i2.p1 TRINITY_DN968_c0_g1~~TRINITY_DN968_c0_g1_i2.p1  ORF type:complete len:107 (-),score=25.92 TRINITY_DN968_c0_g1_i2:186-506(-)